MKGLAVFLLAAITMEVAAKHRKEWQRIDPARTARERFQPFYKSDACRKGVGFYRDPQDCHQYIRCVDEYGSGRHFSVFAGRCEPGLVFDENISACNWPELAAPCSNSPDKLQAAGSGTVAEENVISEETNREKPYPVQQQVVQEAVAHRPHEQEAWEIQVVHPQEQSDSYEPEVTWQQVSQTTRSQAYDQQQEQVPWQDNPAYQTQQQQSSERFPQQPEQHQSNVNQQFEQNEERQQQHEVEPIYSGGKKNPSSQQRPSGAFEEIGDNPQIEISASADEGQVQQVQESQSQWFIPESSPQHNPPQVAEQIPASGEEPVVCEKEGFFRHPDNCSQFIRCVKLEGAYAVHVFECPKQLVFDEKDVACVVDGAQSCRALVRKKRQAPAEQLRCPGEGFFRHPRDCRAFYRCAKTESGSYETHPFSCPAMLVFDEEYTTCNFPEKAPPCNQQIQNRRKPPQTQKPYKQIRTTRKPTNDFIDKSMTETRYGDRRTAKPKTTPSNASSPKCRREGFFSNKNDCTKFYKCVKRGDRYVRYDLNCPNNHGFDDRSKRCIAQRYVASCSKNKFVNNPPRQADEETTASTETTSPAASSSNPSESNDEEIVCEKEGYFRHPKDCNKFYRCVDFEGNGQEFVRYDFDCPEGLIFDEVNSVCNWPDPNSPCEARSGGGGSGGNEGTGEGGNEGIGEGGNEGTGEGGTQGPGEGGNEGTGEGGNQGPGEGGTGEDGNEGPGEGGSDNEPGNDGQDGAGPVTEGGAGSESTEVTSDASSTEIGEGQEGGGNEGGTGGSDGECTKEGFYRNPEDCNKFYRCVDFDGEGKEFVRYDFNCPDGLVFDEKNSVCNWPSESEPCDTKSGGSESGGGSDGSPGGGNEGGGGSDGSDTATSGPEDAGQAGGGSDGSDTATSGSEDGGQAGGDQGGPEATSEQTDVQSSSGDKAPEADQSTPSSPEEGSSEDNSGQEGGPSQPPEETGGSGNSGECTEAGFFRNPDDCNKFYRCVDQNGDGSELVRYDFACPEGLVFDETNSVCNWPDQSPPCEGGSSGGESQPGAGGDGSDSSQPSEGGDASQTTSSSDGASQTTAGEAGGSSEGGAGESSSQSTGGDETTEPVESEQGSTTESTAAAGESGESTSEPSEGGSSENTGECTKEGFYRNPEDCNKFYRCVDFNGDGQQFVRYDFDCPEGLVFDEVNSVCNWPDQTPGCETKGGSGGKETTSGGEATSPGESPTTQSSGSTDQSGESTSQQSTQGTEEQSTQGAGEQSTQTTAGASSQATTGGSETSEQSATSTQASTSKRPASGDGSCSEPGFFRCEDDCNKFYRCVEEGDRLVRYDFKCPDGLVFDDQNKRCDWPSDLFACDSGSSTGAGSTDSTGGASSGTSDAATSESTAQTTESTTAASTTSSATSQASTTGQTSSTSSGTSSSGEECTEEGYFRHPDDCSKYYRCIDEGNGTLTREDFACAEDEVFDEEMRYCNRKDLAPPCDGSETTSSQSQTTSGGSSNESQATTERTTSQPSSESTTSRTTSPPSSESSTSSSTASDSFECREPGFFRCPEDCTKFYRCVENENGDLVRYDFYCPDGLIFDAKKEKCDFPSSELTCDEQSGTSPTQGSTSGSQTPSESTSGSQTTSGSSDATTSSDRTTSAGTTSASSGATDAEGCTEEGYFRNPEDCSLYYRCLDEGDGTLTREDFACEEDEVFDEEMNYCNRKDLAPPCDGSSSSTTGSSTGSTQPSSEQSTSGSTVQEPESTAGSTGGTSQREPESTTGSSGPTGGTSQQEPESTTGSSGSTTGSTGQGPESTTAASGSTSSTGGSGQGSGECEEEGFHRDPNDCNKFYRCVDFRGDGQSYTRYDFECPEGLVFDESVDVCNWPSSVPSCESSDSGSRGGSGSTASGGSSSSTSEEQTSSAPEGGSQTTSQGRTTSQPSTGGAGGTTASSDSTTSQPGSNGESSSSGTTAGGGSSESSGGSSSNIECTEEGFFRHPDDCGKFYRCVDFAGTGESYVRYDFDCPEGLVFDEINSVCNWPNQSPRCESGSKGSSGGDKGSGSSTPGEGTGYDNTSGSTGSEESTTSSSGGSTAPGQPSTGSSSDGAGSTSSSSDGFRCEEEGYFKHPTDCTKYYECKRDEETGELVKIDCECPDGHVWDNEGWYCNAEELSPPCEGSGSSSFRCTEEGFFRDPEDCTRYYRCERSGENEFRSERFQCDEGLVFDEEGRYCNAPELSEPCDGGSSSATTKGTETTGASGTSSTQESTTSGASGPESESGTSGTAGSSAPESTGSDSSAPGECTREGFFRNPEDCTKYYRCSLNEDTGEFDRSDFSCTDGRIFDEQSNYCNEPELTEEPCDTANGGGSTTAQPGSGGATSGSGTGSRVSGGGPQCAQEGFFRHPDDCNKFYRCVDFSGSGESYVRYDFDCPEGLHFDEVNSVCNWPTMTPPCQPGNQLYRQYLGRIN